MKKFLLPILVMLGVAQPSIAQDEKLVAEMPAITAENWAKNSNYTTSQNSIGTYKDQWTIKNFNNNNLGWNGEVRCGSKNGASVAEIIKNDAIEEEVTTVTIHVGAKATSHNSVKLYVADNKAFNNPTTYDFAVPNNGTNEDYSVTVTSPAPNCYYKVVFDMAKGANGNFAVSAVKLYGQEGSSVTPGEPVDPKVDFADITMEVGAAAVKAGTWPSDLDVNFTANPQGIVDIVDGMIAPIAVGSTTVTASWNAVAEKYNAGSVDFTVTVTAEAPAKVYTLVKSQDEIYAGATYLLVGESKGVHYAMADQNGSYRNYTAVEVVNDEIKIKETSDTKAAPITLENSSTAGKFLLKVSDGYLQSPSSNGVNTITGDNGASNRFEVTLQDNYLVDITASSRFLRFNFSSPRVACYTSGQVNGALYKLQDGATPDPTKQPHGLSFDASSLEVVEGTESEGLKVNNPNGLNVVYTSSNTDVADVDPENGSILAYTAGTTTITATTEGNDNFAAGSVSYTLTVTAAPFNNFKDVVTKGLQNGDKVIIEGNFAVLYQNGANTILTDGKSNILIYDYNVPAYEIGTKIAKVSANVKIFYNLFELETATLTEGGNGAEIAPVELTSFEGINYTDNLFDLVTVKGAQISGVSGKQATLTLGGETIALYNNFGIDNYKALENVTLTGFVWRNNNTLQIDPISIVEETGEKVESGLAWSAETYTVMEGTEPAGYPTLINPNGIKVVYTSSNEDVAIYDDGELIIGDAGTAVITVAPADTDKYYGTASFTVNVTAKPELGVITVNGKEVADNDVITVLVNTEITLAAENAEIVECEIEGPAGESINDVVEGASYTFTASSLGEYIVVFTATGYGVEKDVTFSINVVDEEETTEEILDFVNNAYGMERGSTSNNTDYNADGFVLEGTTFEYTVYGTNGTRLWTDGLRLYGSNAGTISVAAPFGYVLTAVEPLTAQDKAVTAGGLTTSMNAGHVNGSIVFTGSKNYALAKMRVVVEKVEAPDADSYSPDVIYNDNIITQTDELTGAITVVITHQDVHASIYFKHISDDESAAKIRRNVVSHEGYEVADATIHDDGDKSVHTFSVPSAGSIEYYAYHAATDTKGEVKSIKVSANGEVTSISEITLDAATDGAVYDLQGRRVAKPARGLYITNGRKVYLR